MNQLVGPLPNPNRDYMQDRDVETVGDAIRKIDAEVNEEYRRAGRPGGHYSANARLDWSMRRNRSLAKQGAPAKGERT